MASGNSGNPASELEKVGTIIARSLAFLCLQNTSAKDGTVLQKAEFLSGLGLSFGDAAGMLGTTAESLRVLAYNKANKRKGAARGKKAKVKTRRGSR
jgi:hypothetical protein